MTYAQIILLPTSASARVAYATDNELVYFIPAGVPGSGAQVLSTEAAAIIAALTNVNLPVEGLMLADSSGDALPAGTLGWNGTNLVLHDGTTVGGNVYPALLPSGDQLTAKGLLFLSTIVANQDFDLRRFPILASQAQVGENFRLYGRMKASWGQFSLTDCILGIAPTASGIPLAPTGGLLYGHTVGRVGYPVTEAIFDYRFTLSDAGSPNYSISEYQAAGLEKFIGALGLLPSSSSGAAYTLTSTFADLVFGGTTPTYLFDKQATIELYARVRTAFVGATFDNPVSIEFKLRDVNNSTDVSEVYATIIPPLTTYTGEGPHIIIGPFRVGVGDPIASIKLQGRVSSAPSAGSLRVTAATIGYNPTIVESHISSGYGSESVTGTVGVDQDLALILFSPIGGTAAGVFDYEVTLEHLP